MSNTKPFPNIGTKWASKSNMWDVRKVVNLSNFRTDPITHVLKPMVIYVSLTGETSSMPLADWHDHMIKIEFSFWRIIEEGARRLADWSAKRK